MTEDERSARLVALVEHDPVAFEMLQELTLEAMFYRDVVVAFNLFMPAVIAILPEDLKLKLGGIIDQAGKHPAFEELQRLRAEREAKENDARNG